LRLKVLTIEKIVGASNNLEAYVYNEII